MPLAVTEAAVVAREEAGLPMDFLPDGDPRVDLSFLRFPQLIEPHHSDGRCLQGWARLRFLKPPPVVR